MVDMTYHYYLGLAADGDEEGETLIVKQKGKVAALKQLVEEQQIDFSKVFVSHCGMVSERRLYDG